MKKIIVSVLALFLAISLSACGKKPIMIDLPDEFDTSVPVEVTFWHTFGTANEKLLKDMIASFNEIYPNIKINPSSQGGYTEIRDKLMKSIPAGEEPSMAICYPDHVAMYLEGEVVVPLNAFIEHSQIGYTKEELNDIIPGFLNEGKEYDDAGTIYSMPYSKSTEVLFYNKTVFDELGLQAPTTWSDVEAIAKKIKETTKYKDTIPFGYDSESNLFITMAAQKGNKYTNTDGDFLFNNKGNKENVELLKRWYDSGYFTSKLLLQNAYTSTEFVRERLFMTVGSTGGTTYNVADGNYEANFEIGVTALPQFNPNKPQVIQQGPSMTFFKKENALEMGAAWLFYKHITNTENTAKWAMETGYSPIRQSAFENEEFKAYMAKETSATATKKEQVLAKVARISKEQADNYFTSPAFNGSSTARDQVGFIIEAVLLETKTIDKAFKDAIAECEL